MGLLYGLGYRHVRHYAGGLAEWMDRGDRIEPGPIAMRNGRVAVAPPPGETISARFVDALADRTVGQLFALWVEVIVVCGIVYWLLEWLPWAMLSAGGVALEPTPRNLLATIYFSAVTATSIGYGDIVPVGIARVMAVAESVAGLIIFGCVISKFVSRRQEQLIEEIHRITFEDRLGRVRTNLHLVRTELQETARLCKGHDVPPPEAIARVESVSMIFVGELRAVHDLLYRPQQTPDEGTLESILAGLASVFREFHELLECVKAERPEKSAAFRSSLASMSRLAGEICGDCVPRQYAPALRTWMDQIQDVARDIARL